jgi:SAM-dependent methyltransferase
MREKLERIKALVDELLSSLPAADGSASIPTFSAAAPDIAAEEMPSSPDWAEIRRLLDSEDWPQAVFAVQIADDNSNRDKEERAEGICDIILPPLSRKKFLDFGCGEGHVATCVSKEAVVSVGYDIHKPPKSKFTWEEKRGGLLLTTDFARARQSGPYDAVLLYDVIDHASGESPAEILSKSAEVLAEDGRIYMRCHPWCGRHGGHAYRKVNKAFAHLVLTDDELKSMGVESEPNIRVTKPLWMYNNAIRDAGLVQDSEPEIDSQEVEDFFRDTPLVRDRILKVWGVDKWENDPPSFQMSQCFVDYVLKKKSL